MCVFKVQLCRPPLAQLANNFEIKKRIIPFVLFYFNLTEIVWDSNTFCWKFKNTMHFFGAVKASSRCNSTAAAEEGAGGSVSGWSQQSRNVFPLQTCTFDLILFHIA